MQKSIDFTKTIFKKSQGIEIPNVIDYINNYCRKGGDVRVTVGCDSKQKARTTLYSLVIMLYDESLHNGAHILYIKFQTNKEKDLFSRMMNEATYSLYLGLYLDENLNINKPNYKRNDYDNSISFRKVEIHVDVNPNVNRRSNVAYNAIEGMLVGSGFYVKAKPIAPAASSAADYLMK